MKIHELRKALELREALKTVLDFVERWNKEDREVDVAAAAEKLSKLL